MQLDYGQERFTKARVWGFECNFSDICIDKKTELEGRYHYCMKAFNKNRDYSIKNGEYSCMYGVACL